MKPRKACLTTHFRDNYAEVKREAQTLADETGFDYGIDGASAFGYRLFMLPRKENRNGHELRCEVVWCSDLSRQQPGHGT